ncbi:uncharacterized protein [Cherax quadricarinatus]|uniref:uncharacterized protein n=1 Tax=Cherax quadricarinatus TaxID=27406 RepID=UPI00387E232F
MWRLAPMGDAQVTVLLPRDTDSMIIQREVDAVREWLSSGKQFHIMRDHPKHDSLLLAGLWGVRWGPDLTGPAARNQDMGNTGFPAYHKDSDTVELAVQRLNSNPTRPAARKDNLSTTAFAARNQDSWSAGFTSGNHDLDYTQYHGYFLTVLRDDMMTLAKRKKAQNYGGDQRILDKIMWPVIKGHALTHDSYRCGQYEKDSIPWPTQRVDGLFVGCRRFKKNFENENIMEECPEKCRPPEHPDWLYC